jgi:N6-adenosine-specific RNA methylase IME4
MKGRTNMTDKRYPDRGFKDSGPEKDEWKREGIELAKRHDATVWEIGDWYLRGRQSFGPGECRLIIEAPGWQGVKFDTAKVYACVASRYPEAFRYLNTSPAHYHSARVLPLEQSIPLLTQAADENWNLNKLRIAVRRTRWFKELVGGDIIDDLNDAIRDNRKWRGIDADPPWEWDTAGGRRGATTGHYPTMPLDKIRALPVSQVAYDDAFLFLWVPPALLMTHGNAVLESWGFEYKTNITWDKLTHYGRGAYVRTVHEHLLIGVRPKTPTHFLDNDMLSMIRARLSRRNSEKPDGVHELIQRATPGPYLELFARKRVKGWDCYGNQLPPNEDDIPLAAD